MVLAAACGSPEPDPPSEQVTGLIAAIERAADGAIESFTVRDGEKSYTIRIDPERDYGFNLKHLQEHRALDLPVRVRLEQRGEELYALEIVDA